MTTFTVWRFDTPDGADHASSLLKDAQAEQLVRIVDRAVVSWPPGEEGPTVKHSRDDTKRGAAWGSVWGVMFGALFAVPVVGLAVGGATGALLKAKEKLGVSQEQMDAISEQITEGTSALFVVTDHGDLDRLGERFRGMHMTLVQSNLTDVERDELLETFGSG